MNAMNGLAKVMVCGVAALALTVASGWAMVEANKTAHWPADMPTVIIVAKADSSARLAQNTTAGLLQ